MLRIIIFLVLTLVSATSAYSQRYDWKRGLLRGSTFIFAGVGSGLHEVIQHPQTYAGFKRVFPNSADRFWNPSISWERKYDDPYPLSRTFPIFTDAYHLTNAVRTVGLIGSTMYITIGKKRPWWHYGIDLAIGSVFYGIGSNVTYQYFKSRGQ